MNKERMGEIAVLILKDQMRAKGLHFGPMEAEAKRQLPNDAQRIGITVDELKQFSRTVYQELHGEWLKRADEILGPMPS